MRLDKFLSDYTPLTRSLAAKAIKAGRVQVNGSKAKSGSHKIQPQQDQVCLNGEVVEATAGARYFMMHKPQGMVCANSDGEHPLVFDLMRNEINVDRLHTVGRLDKDTTGLLLITDDGQWSHQITSPKHHFEKTYRAWLAEPLIDEAESRCEQGIELKDELKPTLPAQLKRITDTEVLITIHEGRYHQVKRMFAALGNRVTALHRESIGGVQLDAELKPGDYRLLSQDEVAAFANKA